MTPSPAKTDRRVQFDLAPERLSQLDILMDLCDFSSRKELVNTAISLLQWAVESSLKGQAVAAYDRASDHVEIIKMLPLENAARKKLTHRGPVLEHPETVSGPVNDQAKSKAQKPVHAD